MFTEKKRSVLPRFSGFFAGRSTGCSCARSVAMLLLVGILAGPVAAQQQHYKAIPPKMTIKASKPLGSKVSEAMRNRAAFDAGGQKNIDGYFKTFYFPMMTQAGPADLARLGKLREDLFKRYLRGSTIPAAQAYLTNTTLGVMRAIARDDYHPAVRYNAALILGLLDQQYAAGGANSTPPVVLPAATNELLELLEQSEFNGVQVHPSVKVGALEGLERHVRFGLDAQATDRVTQAALAVLAQAGSTLEVEADVHHWIQCQAARVLVRQFQAGPNAAVHTALTKLISNDKMSLEARCCIVGLLEKMTYTVATGADVASTLVPLGNLTKAVVAEGAEQAQEFEDLMLGNNPGRGRRGNFGGGRDAEGPKLERRQLLSRLTLIEKGAHSLSEGLPEAERQKMQSLTALLMPVIKKSLHKKTLDLEVTGEILQLQGTINTIVASWQPVEPVADSADADFAE